MCFSAEADFVAGLALAPVGVIALRAAPTRRDLPIAALPAIFSVHQLIEGFVWLGLDGSVGPDVRQAAITAYLLIAQVLLPVLVPWAIWLIEPPGARRRALAVLGAIGLAAGTRLAFMLAGHTPWAEVRDHALFYGTDVHIGWTVTVAYLLATCGAMLLSGFRYLRWFGVVNAIGIALTAYFYFEQFTSIWCLYAALASGMILLHLRERRRGLEQAVAVR